MKKNIVYNLSGHSPRCGFFCMFSNICSYLYDTDNNINIRWYNNKFTKNSDNALDYIFKQKYPKKFEVVEPSVNIWSGNVSKYFTTNPSSNPENLEEFNRLFWSKFKINKNLKSKIEELNKIKNNKKTLSVHIRRSDILCETYFLPYINFDINDLENYYKKINEVFINGGYEKIFLCTEDEDVLNFLKNKISDDVLFFQKTARVSNGNVNSDSSLDPIYDHDGEQLLLEIMSDVLFAKECEGFLGTIFSGVSIFIEVFNNNKFKTINYF